MPINIYKTLFGIIVTENKKVIKKHIFKSLKEYKNSETHFGKTKKQYPKANIAKKFPKKPEFFKEFHQYNIMNTKQLIKDSTKKDNMITQAVNNIDDIERIKNNLTKRLREWYSFYLPELDKIITNNDKYVKLVLTQTKEQLIDGFKIKQTMGADFSKNDLEPIKKLAKKIQEMQELQDSHKEYLEKTMMDLCPNLTTVAGSLIGARLMTHAGSIKKLAEMPASTIQLLGAEKALFRHLKTKARCPRHGLIINHPLLANAKQKDHGKIARHLASSMALAARVDFFQGDPNTGFKLREKLDKLFGK